MTSPAETKNTVAALLALIEKLPENLATFSRETQKFQLVCVVGSDDYQTWWLDIGTMLQRVYQENGRTYANTLDRLQMLLDLAVAAKAAEAHLRYKLQEER